MRNPGGNGAWILSGGVRRIPNARNATAFVVIAGDLFKLKRSTVAIAAIVLSSVLFSDHHHPPIGTEPFELIPFAFRALAGIYLALIFWFRGYGAAAGTHAAYNTIILLYGAFSMPNTPI